MGPTHPSSFASKLPIDFDDGEAVDTCPDFWKLCWDTRATIIVMLCSIAPGFRGCSLYFPEGKYPGIIMVTSTVYEFTINRQNNTKANLI